MEEEGEIRSFQYLFLDDLSEAIQTWIESREHIILAIDLNSYVKSSEEVEIFKNARLVKAITERHSNLQD